MLRVQEGLAIASKARLRELSCALPVIQLRKHSMLLIDHKPFYEKVSANLLSEIQCTIVFGLAISPRCSQPQPKEPTIRYFEAVAAGVAAAALRAAVLS